MPDTDLSRPLWLRESNAGATLRTPPGETRAIAISRIPLRIAHLSDIHFGGSLSLSQEYTDSIAERVNRMEPDVVVIAGDLSTDGYEWEFAGARRWLDLIEPDTVIIPGNHDARNVGYLQFQRLFGSGYFRYRKAFESTRAERLQAPGFTIVGVDSSEPDINEGEVGRERYPWIRDQYSEPDDVKIFVIHHHLVSIPGTGRERNIITDAGDVLALLSHLDVDVVLSGHKHVPCFWGVNGMLVCNSGTAGTRRVRGLSPPSWNELVLDASTIKVYIHYEDGRRELSAIFSRKTRALVKEAFYLTDEFLGSNQVLAL